MQSAGSETAAACDKRESKKGKVLGPPISDSSAGFCCYMQKKNLKKKKKKQKQDENKVRAERCREPGDNQIALFLYTSLTVGAERQIAGLPVKELEDWTVPTLPAWKSCNTGTQHHWFNPKMAEQKPAWMFTGIKINFRKMFMTNPPETPNTITERRS